MVDTANILSELAADDVAAGVIATGRFAQQVEQYVRRPIDVKIWGLDKQTLDFRVYVTDVKGIVLFDSTQVAVGQDYSGWRDVARTLRGEYGARATREIQQDQRTSVMYVAAPVLRHGQVIGVLTVAKPMATVQAFVDRAERKILVSGLWLLALSAAVGVAVTLWVVWSIRQLRQYANAVESGKKVAVPRIPGELGELARAMEAMRVRVQGREYVEAYVRALTHELKSPLAAIRAAAELLQEPLPEPDRQGFTQEVLDQTGQLQSLVDRMLELSKLEQRETLNIRTQMPLRALLQPFQHTGLYKGLQVSTEGDDSSANVEPQLMALALTNLLENAAAFAPASSQVAIEVHHGVLSVQDQGPGVAAFALQRMGSRFFSTVRPDGVTKGSGLGLAIVRQIMVLHGGDMRVINTGTGLRVELHFPQGDIAV
jgi:two-component system, OmpR family, sensor histidine kinase CreC